LDARVIGGIDEERIKRDKKAKRHKAADETYGAAVKLPKKGLHPLEGEDNKMGQVIDRIHAATRLPVSQVERYLNSNLKSDRNSDSVGIIIFAFCKALGETTDVAELLRRAEQSQAEDKNIWSKSYEEHVLAERKAKHRAIKEDDRFKG
jgi:hypothetical protein